MIPSPLGLSKPGIAAAENDRERASISTIDRTFTIEFNRFATHVARSKNKYAADRYWKINGQDIYNGAIHRHTRAIVMNNMHTSLFPGIQLLKNLMTRERVLIDGPVHLDVVVRCPEQWATVRLVKHKVRGLEIMIGKPGEATWDLDNLTFIWKKAIQDALVQQGVLKKDTVRYIGSASQAWQPCKELGDRCLIVTMTRKTPMVVVE